MKASKKIQEFINTLPHFNRVVSLEEIKAAAEKAGCGFELTKKGCRIFRDSKNYTEYNGPVTLRSAPEPGKDGVWVRAYLQAPSASHMGTADLTREICGYDYNDNVPYPFSVVVMPIPSWTSPGGCDCGYGDTETTIMTVEEAREAARDFAAQLPLDK
jgi:hypothetical protein